MKKTILLLAAILVTGLSALAQNTYNVVIFSEDGDPFYAFVNGIKQNEKPETNIKVTGLNSEALNVRVEFENKALPKLKQNMMPEVGYEHTINIRKSLKKELKMTYFGKVALADAPKSSATTIPYHTADNSVTNTDNTSTNSTTNNFNTGDGNTTITTTTVSTNTRVNSDPNNVSINMNMGGHGMNVNVSGLNANGATQSSSSTTVTSSSTSYTATSSGTAPETGDYAKTTSVQKTDAHSQDVRAQAPVSGGCRGAMAENSFEQMKKAVEDKPFSDTKMSTAKIATKNACLSVNQIKEICGLFSMDDDKLAYAKFAYDHCIEKANYYSVSEIFSFSTTTDQLNKFLESK